MVASTDRPLVRPLLLAGVVLTGFGLRPAVTSVGALMPELRASVPLGPGAAGLLTALPTLCFAGLGLAAPRIARRAGPERTVAAAFALVGVGLAARAAAGGPVGFLAGSTVALAGIAAANVLGPPLITRWFPDRVGPVTGLYAMSIAAGVALPAAVSVPVAELAGDGGWRAGLGVWAPVALLAALPWTVRAVRRRAPDPVPSGGRAEGPGRVTTLALAGFFGLQSLGAFVLMGWLPAVFVDAGVPPARAGVLLAVTAALAVPAAVLVPVLADRARLRPLLVVGVSGTAAAGWAGMLLAPAVAPWLWALLLASMHCAYPLAIALVRVQAGGPAAELRLSGVVQTGGYLLAATGPPAAGVLRDATGGWTVPLSLVLGLLVLQALAGLRAARTRPDPNPADDPESGAEVDPGVGVMPRR